MKKKTRNSVFGLLAVFIVMFALLVSPAISTHINKELSAGDEEWTSGGFYPGEAAQCETTIDMTETEGDWEFLMGHLSLYNGTQLHNTHPLDPQDADDLFSEWGPDVWGIVDWATANHIFCFFTSDTAIDVCTFDFLAEE
ncbi:MAG: hypothetical protein P9L92_14955 [Candidatus Electryonea clarkiae]|nr:hypothetical protein [Candidatus Electryonea clarkiae]MDP8288654.1 hypothetical protein [Candidatus Electryonea clarkiae]